MSHLHASPLAGLSAALILGLTLAGCSSEDPADDTSRTSANTSGSETSLQVRSTVARVQGRLSEPQRAQLADDVGEVIAGYLAASYLHERDAEGYKGSFPGFTRGAWALAMKDVAIVSDAAFEGADEITSRGAAAFLSVVAPEGRAVGATARVFLDLRVSQDGRHRAAAVRGKLLLTPNGDSWNIFGYDLSLDTSPRRGRGR